MGWDLNSILSSWAANPSNTKAFSQYARSNPGIISRSSKQKLRAEMTTAVYALQSSLNSESMDMLGGGSVFKGWGASISDGPDGLPVAALSFNGEVARPSLNPDSSGVTNILVLLNNGYQTGGNTPWGSWKVGESTIRIKGLTSRAGTHSIGKAVEQFNKKYKGKFVASYVGDRFSGIS